MAKPERERNITGKCKKRTRLLLLGQRPSAIMKKMRKKRSKKTNTCHTSWRHLLDLNDLSWLIALITCIVFIRHRHIIAHLLIEAAAFITRVVCVLAGLKIQMNSKDFFHHFWWIEWWAWDVMRFGLCVCCDDFLLQFRSGDHIWFKSKSLSFQFIFSCCIAGVNCLCRLGFLDCVTVDACNYLLFCFKLALICWFPYYTTARWVLLLEIWMGFGSCFFAYVQVNFSQTHYPK